MDKNKVYTWMTVQEMAYKLDCTAQYVRYLISGRNRKYENRVKKDLPKIPQNLIKVTYYGKNRDRVKYSIHNSVIQLIRNSKKKNK